VTKTPNPSIERTSSGLQPPSAAHVKRWKVAILKLGCKKVESNGIACALPHAAVLHGRRDCSRSVARKEYFAGSAL
jgi:hypothetical protein